MSSLVAVVLLLAGSVMVVCLPRRAAFLSFHARIKRELDASERTSEPFAMFPRNCSQKSTRVMRVWTETRYKGMLRRSRSRRVRFFDDAGKRTCLAHEKDAVHFRKTEMQLHSDRAPPGHCSWTVRCVANDGRRPTFWLEAILTNPDRRCGPTSRGVCILNRVKTTALFRRACDHKNRPVWVMETQEIPISASCVGPETTSTPQPAPEGFQGSPNWPRLE